MKNCVLLIDFNNLLFRTLFAKDVGIRSEIPNFVLWRYLVYDSIFQSMKHVGDVKEIVLAVDDKNSWRRSYFKRYKESRKPKREKLGINWPFVFKTVNKYISDVKHHMPFKVLRIRSAEADDVIGLLALDSGENCIISSNDEDYLQLCSENIKLWNPSKREYLDCKDTEMFLIQKCLTGQPKDDIFNVMTPNDWGKTEETFGKRKPGLGEKTAIKIIAKGYEQWLEDNDLEDNFKRNKILIDFRLIPNTIKRRIMDAYYDYNFPPPRNIYQFFKKYNMRGYLEDFDYVERRLMTLYGN